MSDTLRFEVPTALQYFASLVAEDEGFALLEAAISVAQDEYPQLDPQGVINARDIRVIDEDTAMDAGIYTFTLTEAGKSRQVQARYTYVYEKLDGEWKIVLHHSSAMPEPVAHLASN